MDIAANREAIDAGCGRSLAGLVEDVLRAAGRGGVTLEPATGSITGLPLANPATGLVAVRA
jgi:hypothetical protein